MAFDAYETVFEAVRASVEVMGKEVVVFKHDAIEISVRDNKNLIACKTFNEALENRNRITGQQSVW